MRKITPMILVMLMLVSALSSFDFAELEETEVIEDTGARSGADADLIAITSPKETVCPVGADCRNVLKVGDSTTFETYIKNSGDADITEMSYTVNIWLSDADGNPSMIAKDANGADLSWTNNDVMCAGSQCDFQSLAAGGVLGGGKHTMSVGGTPITWTPMQGLYVVEIVVDADPDADVGNDAQQVFVQVEDWYDIVVDLSWDSGMETESGSGAKQWTLNVNASGSNTFEPRNVQVTLQTFGDVSAAQSTDGTPIDGSGTTTFTAGTSTLVDIYENFSTEPSTVDTDTRSVLTSWTLTGSLTVDVSSQDDASYGMKATLRDFVGYDQYPECVYTSADNETFDNICEKTLTRDAYPATDASTLDGFVSVFNDIRISQLTVVQGFNADGTGEGTSFFTDVSGGELSVGTSYLHAEVQHRGSEADSSYEWDVEFQVTDSSGNAGPVVNSTTCEAVQPAYPVYAPLGTGAGETLIAYACTMVDLSMDGEYTFTATLVNDTKMEDAKPSNNEKSMTLNVRNNAPLILSLELLNDEELYIGQEDLLSMAVQVFDVDDPSASGIEIEWMYNGMALPGCERAPMLVTCSVVIDPAYVTNFPVAVNVYDAHGGEVSGEIMLQVWNDGSYASSTESGLQLSYELLYWGTTPFTVESVDGDAMTNLELPGFTGRYDTVGVIDYTPSTTYSANDVLEQSMSIQYAKSLEATSLWYVNGATWTMLTDVSTDVDATTGQFTYAFPANSPILASGQLVLMGGSLAQAEIPSASITAFNAAAAKGGAIQINWGVDGTMLGDDSIDITVCEVTDCTSPFEISLGAGNTSYSYSGQSTTHGVEYAVTVAVCNEVGCSTPVGTGTVVADSAVDGGVSATGLTIAADKNTWTVSWTAEGAQDDVASWKVCYQRGTFDAANMPETCLDAAGTTVDVDISTWSAGTYTYHFTAVPVDALGNSMAAGSMNSIEYQRDADNTNVDDGSTVVGEEVDSGVPTWTWGVIGGVVVVAFVVGAFILSRGGEGDEGKDWDY